MADTRRHDETGRARVVFAPTAELSLAAAQELVSLVHRITGSTWFTVHWAADDRSPEVVVESAPRHFDRAMDKLLKEIGGFGKLGTPTQPVDVAAEGTRGRALLVTADDATREVARMMLSAMGLDVEDVESYAEAEARVRREEYDVLVVTSFDVEVDDVGRLLFALDPLLEMTTPVVLWSDAFEAEPPSWLEGLRAPLAVLTRPNDYRVFGAKVRTALAWRHLVRMRRAVRAHVEAQVQEHMAAFSRDLLGLEGEEATSESAEPVRT